MEILKDIDYLICIPVYKVSSRTRKCIRSLKDYSHVLLVDNTGKKECKQFESLGLEVSYQEQNIGVSRAWNIGLKKRT